MAEPFYTRHRGPYVLQVFRHLPRRGKRYPGETKTLPGEVSGPECEEESRMLLGDPRDTIESVYVWSVSEQQHVCTFTKEKV